VTSTVTDVAANSGVAGVGGRIGRLASGLAGLTGWRRYVAAGAAGSLATLALPPAYAAPLLWISFPTLLWLLDGANRPLRGFAVGWTFGFAHHLLGLYWISFALLVDAERFAWLMPFAAAGIPAVLALFTGAAGAALAALRPLLPRPLARVLAFAVLWSVAEWLRGHLFTGFPWNLIGYSWIGWLPVAQSLAFVGSYGLGLLTVAAASLPYLLRPSIERTTGPLAIAGVAAFPVVFAGGALRMAMESPGHVPGVMLRVVQPNIPQTLKADPVQRARNFRTTLELSIAGRSPAVTDLVWPETAAMYLVESDPIARQAIAAVTPAGGLTLTGALRLTGADGDQHFWNSLLAVDHDARVVASYDKFHLVPFGEYVPLRRWLPLQAVASIGDMSAGPGPRLLDLPGLPPVSPLICYEVVFPHAVVPAAGRPQWIVNVTNDGWYGRTAGPHQHFAMAQARAIEEGLPVVRAANTGISGVIDPLGRITAQLGLGRQGVVDAALPGALEPTVYGRFGDLPFAVVLLLFAAAAVRTRRSA
jgi:apolipoprotein N-acyltransferase